MKIRYLFIIIFSCIVCFGTNAQQVDEDAVRKELEKQGVSEEEVTKRLIERGYDPENIDLNNPSQLIELQAAADEIVKEIKAEKLAAGKNSGALDTLRVVSNTIIEEDLGNVEKVINEVPSDLVIEEEDKALEIYGHHLFKNRAINFYSKIQYVKPPPSYILGPGDRVTVAIWGNSEANFNKVVSSDGWLKYPQMGRVYVAGLSLKDVKKILKSKFARNYNFYNGSDFEATVSGTRSISVFLTGELTNQGSYNISALNTAINALAAAGGPTDIGSVRNIQLMKASGERISIDLYQFINDPIVSQNLYLEDNDYIAVPIANKIVSISGAVNRAYKYELLPNETLKDLLDFAGGLKPNALKKNVNIKRFENDQLVILSVDLTDNNALKDFKLRNGDRIEISAINERLRNVVNVSGAIDNIGEFSIDKNMRLSALLDKVVLRNDAILDLAYLVRVNDDKKTSRYEIINIENALSNKGSDADLLMQEGDRLIIRGKSDYVTNYSFEVAGSVRNPDSFKLDGETQIRISDAINLAGGILPTATDFGYIIRKVPGSIAPEYILIEVRVATENPASDKNILLSPGDKLEIYERSRYSDETYVSIEGAVRSPKNFEYSGSLTLKDAILQAGGLTLQAASNNIDIFRIEFLNNNKTRTLVANAAVDENLNIKSGGNLKLMPFDQIVVRTAAEFELQRSININGEIKYPGRYVLVDDNTTLSSMINEAGGLTEESFPAGTTLFRSLNDVGFVIIDLEEAMKKENSTINMIMQAGDIITIPKQNNLVTVVGAVDRQIAFIDKIANSGKTNFVFESGKSAKDYIQESGGFADNADKGSTSVTYPNGEVHKTKKFLFFKNYPRVVPGSLITVSAKKLKEKPQNNGKEKEDIDWGKVISNSIAQATGILSLILLIQTIN
ncbi:MAG: protein involved in polysaccharide export with SLBB domain [Saprospiraceae bacterium]|jgi:protein involved in polysaccharide export with SLBB domain